MTTGGAGTASGGSGGILDDAGPVTETTFIRAIAAMGSCMVDDGPLRTTTYLRARQGGYVYPGVVPLSCLAQVTNGCSGVFECWGYDPMQNDAGIGTCVGNTAVFGEGSWDCTQMNATCQSGRCLGPGQQLCGSTYTSSCDSQGRPIECDSAVMEVGPVCSAFGLDCTAMTFDAYCVGTGSTCTGSDTTYFDIAPAGTACTGNTLSACVGGKTADLDCALLGDGFSCQTFQGAFFCGIAAECDPLAFGRQCDGTTVVFCDAGKLSRVDCTSLGFSACGSSESRLCVP